MRRLCLIVACWGGSEKRRRRILEAETYVFGYQRRWPVRLSGGGGGAGVITLSATFFTKAMQFIIV
jgi:hypothetical protein